jgi:hypothetical protein
VPAPVCLKLTMEKQIGHNTCWAAVAVAIATAYGDGMETQCEVAQRMMPLLDCCPLRGPFIEAICDKACELPPALGAHFLRESTDPAEWTPSYVKAQIDAGAPLAVRVRWKDSGDSGHFVVISGYLETGGDLDLYIHDPIDGLRTRWRFQRFLTAYGKKAGEWSIAFETTGTGPVPREP